MDGGRLSSSGANSRRVNAEWADRGWGGPPGKTAQLRSFLGPPYLCLRVLSPGQARRKHGVRAEGEKWGGRKEGTPSTKERDSSLPPTQGERLMAGTVTTRKHATHARTLYATGRGACAQECKLRPSTPSPRPSTRRSFTKAAPPHLTTGRMRISYSLTFDFTAFPSYSAQSGMRTTSPSGTALLFPPFTGLRRRVRVHSPLWGCLTGNARTSRRRTSFRS